MTLSLARRHLPKVREGGRIVSAVAIIAVAASTEGRREIVGLGIGPSEAEPFWSTFRKALVRRGLHGVKLVIFDAQDGLRHAITRVLGTSWQRCRVHWMRNALAHVPKGQRTVVAAAIRQAFLQVDGEVAHQTWRHVADQLRTRWPRLVALIVENEHGVLTYMTFLAQHGTKLHSTNPLKRLNKEVKRRADVVGIIPNEASITRLIGAVLLEQNDEWLLQCCYMRIEGMAPIPPLIDAGPSQFPPMAARLMATSNHILIHTSLTDVTRRGPRRHRGREGGDRRLMPGLLAPPQSSASNFAPASEERARGVSFCRGPRSSVG
jgi:putative transposase